MDDKAEFDMAAWRAGFAAKRAREAEEAAQIAPGRLGQGRAAELVTPAFVAVRKALGIEIPGVPE